MPIKPRQKWFLREWRKYRDLSQGKLAERLGTSKGYISDLEAGRRQYNQDQLEAIADALGCEPADLLIRNPLDDAAFWSIWDQVPEADRPAALKMLRALAPGGKKDGTN